MVALCILSMEMKHDFGMAVLVVGCLKRHNPALLCWLLDAWVFSKLEGEARKFE